MPPGESDIVGVYVLLIEMERPGAIQVGKRLCIHFQGGFYGYVGSALNGLGARLARHLGDDKKYHWHIDYLLDRAMVRTVIYAPTVEKKECSLARELAFRLSPVTGFGSSDCRCSSHLFFYPDPFTLQKDVIAAFKKAGLKPVIEQVII